MCFSATASFTTGAMLIPLGMYCLKDSLSWNKNYIGFAAFPLAFGIQQLLEGFIWQYLDNDLDPHLPAHGFLFFSHFFWLFWVPFAALLVETREVKKKVLTGCLLIGFIFGVSMFLPFVLYDNWVSVSILNHSIIYKVNLIYDQFMTRQIIQFLYILIVVFPLLFSSLKVINYFGILILLSILMTSYYFEYAFVSVWCYFSAVLSAYLFFVIYQGKKLSSENVYN